jgi:hypothetical protein
MRRKPDPRKPDQETLILVGEADAAARKLKLPEGLDWETLRLAVQIVEDWEAAGSENGVKLVLSLYPLLKGKG